MKDAVFYEVFDEEENQLRKFLSKEIDAEFVSHTIQASGHKTIPAPIISIRTQSSIPASWATELRGILTRSVGYDHLEEYCRRAGANVPCGYLVNYCSRAVAEHVLLNFLAVLRNFNKQQEQFVHFKRDNITGRECLGKNLLVVGVGNIGTQIAALGRGIGMNIKGVDIAPKQKDIEHVPLEEGVRWADIIALSLPLTEQTEGMINYSLLKQSRQGCILVNISRGEITPAEDLKKLLSEEHLGGLSLDVYPGEGALAEFLRGNSQTVTPSMKTILELKEFENVFFTPHNAFNTLEAVENKARQAADAVDAFLSSGKFINNVSQKQ